jgi:hypothetical protein
MKAKVVTSFIDKETKKLITSGSEIDLDQKRVEALIEQGFVVKIENKSNSKAEEKKP